MVLAFLGFRNDTPASTSILQPRFGFQLDATESICLVNNRIVSAELRGGYGLFAGRVPNVWLQVHLLILVLFNMDQELDRFA